MERYTGRYLNKHNTNRPSSGRSWERQQLTQQAAELLEEREIESTQLRNQAEVVSGFAELLSLIPDGKSVPVTPAKFIELYKDLPHIISNELIDPVELGRIYRKGNWQRTSVWRKPNGGVAYLVDDRNGVIQSIYIEDISILAASFHNKVHSGALSKVGNSFSWRSYSSERFFNALERTALETRNQIFLDPLMLLDLPINIRKIGIAAIARDTQFSLLGFEYSGNGGIVTRTYISDTEALQRLRWEIAWAGRDSSTESRRGKQPNMKKDESITERKVIR